MNNLFNDSFSDSDSSHNKSFMKTQLYGKYAKSGTYFKRLRQQVIDKFISGKPLINIDRMYNNPEVKKMFGIINDSEKTNYQSSNSYKNKDDTINNKMKFEEERDRRIPPSKFIIVPIPNNDFNNNTNNLQYNDISNINNNNSQYNNINNDYNSNYNNNIIEEINTNNFNMNKINPIYYNNQNLRPNNINIYQNNNYIPHMFNQQKRIKSNNNIGLMSTSDNNEINSINNNNERDIFEYNYLHEDLNNEFRKKRISDNKFRRENYMINFNEINEEINNDYNNNYYQNENKQIIEAEDINNLLNNLKKENNNYNIFTGINKDNDSYFNNLLIKKEKENKYINYFDNQQGINESLVQNNGIRFGTPPKK